MNSGVVAVVPILVLVVLETATTSTTSAQALPNCPDRCGDVKISYPSGTVEGCYLRDELFINCTSTEDNTTVAKLNSPPSSSPTSPLTDLIVTNITLDSAEFRVRSSVYQDCGSGEALNQWLQLPSPFAFSTKNIFFAVGCATFAKYRGYQYRPSRMLTPYEEQAYSKSGFAVTQCDDSLGTSCSGNGCSQSSIPSGLQNFTVESLLTISIIRVHVPRIGNLSNKFKLLECNYGFLAEQGYFSSSPNKSTNAELLMYTRLPVPTAKVVDWKIGDVPCEEAQKNMGSYACKENSVCVNRSNVNESGYESYDGLPLGYICQCLPGYQGNPYLPDGCQDINECQSSNPCRTEEHCVNLPGQYKCVPNDQLKKSFRVSVSLGISASVLFVIVVGGLGTIYWGMKKRENIYLKDKYRNLSRDECDVEG